jgi:hypothetical protein
VYDDMTKNLEIKTIEHKGITVSIKIDYDTGEASLVDQENDYKVKQWVFKNGTLPYMETWENVLLAMAVAVGECKKELEFSLAQRSGLEKKDVSWSTVDFKKSTVDFKKY